MLKYIGTLMALVMLGCSIPSTPPNAYWGHALIGYELYCNNGGHAASVFNGQACVFEGLIGCHYYETDKQAIADVISRVSCPYTTR